MTESLITKKKIAKSFKLKVKEKSFEKVTVSDIMRESRMRRQTFYDHFQDKFELTDWIFDQEAHENIVDFLEYEDWRSVLVRLFQYLEKNQELYRQVFNYNGQNSFREYYTIHVSRLLDVIFDRHKPRYREAPKKEKIFMQRFYALAIVEVTYQWLLEECACSPQKISNKIQMIIEETFHSS